MERIQLESENMSDTKPLRLYSKSSVERDSGCKRAYYLNYCYAGKGIVTSNTSLELFMGAAIHDAFAALAMFAQQGVPVDIDLIAETAFKQMSENLSPLVIGELDGDDWVKEQSTLVEGIVRGFYKHTWPSLIAQYPIIKLIEQPMIYKHDGLGFMSKPDLVLGTGSGENWYIEYKSTSSKKEGWVNSWDTAVQVHSSIKAIEDFLGEPVQGVIVQGLYKGYESYGKQSSPFCYSYKKNGNPPFFEDTYLYEYKAGFKRTPTWEMAGGVKKWVDEMPTNVLADQFPQTPPIFVNEELIAAFFRQRAIREWEIQHAVEALEEPKHNDERQEILDRTFPQDFGKCRPPYGGSRPCVYLKICHSDAGRNPMDCGFSLRDDSHQDIFRDLLKDA